MSALTTLKDRLRAMLGSSHPRQLPRRGAKPRIGSYVVHVGSGVRLMVQAGMSDELWIWLMDHGWRVVTYRPERRRYRDIPASYVTQLIDSHASMRNRLMAEAIQNAESRAVVSSRASAG
jgi:hypothetical protein